MKYGRKNWKKREVAERGSEKTIFLEKGIKIVQIYAKWCPKVTKMHQKGSHVDRGDPKNINFVCSKIHPRKRIESQKKWKNVNNAKCDPLNDFHCLSVSRVATRSVFTPKRKKTSETI